MGYFRVLYRMATKPGHLENINRYITNAIK